MKLGLQISTRAARLRRRLASNNGLHAIVTCALLGLLLASAASRGWQPGVNSAKRTAADPAASDAPAKFSETRVGHILYSPYVGDDCRHVLFDNRTGALREGKPVRCAQTQVKEAASAGSDRVLTLRKSFQK